MSDKKDPRGRKPYGTRPGEKRILETIMLKSRRRGNGKIPSPSRIATEMNDENIPSRYGRGWTGATITGILAASKKKQQSPKKAYPRKSALAPADYYSAEQVKDHLLKLEGYPKLRILYAAMVGTGLRAMELCNLRACDIDPEKRMIDVRCGKGAKRRSVFLSEAVAMLFREVLRRPYIGKYSPVFPNYHGRAMCYSSLRKKIQRIGNVLGLPGFHAHALRHTYAMCLYGYHPDLLSLKEQMGHTSTNTTEIYAKSMSHQRLQQAEVFDGLINFPIRPGTGTEKLSKTTQFLQPMVR